MSTFLSSPTIVIDLTISRGKCGFCSVNGHNITQCRDLITFENTLLAKWRENLPKPDLFVEWLWGMELFEAKMIPYTRRIYALNQQKCFRYDKASCLSAICNRMNTLHLASFIEATIDRHEVLEQEQMLAELEAEQMQAASAASFNEDGSRAPTPSRKRKVVLIFDDCDTAEDSSDHSCSICFDSFQRKDMVKLNCGHLFCPPCGVKLRQDLDTCAICRVPITETCVSSFDSLQFLKKI